MRNDRTWPLAVHGELENRVSGHRPRSGISARVVVQQVVLAEPTVFHRVPTNHVTVNNDFKKLIYTTSLALRFVHVDYIYKTF